MGPTLNTNFVSFSSDWFVATQPAFSHTPDAPASNTVTAAPEMDATNMNATAKVKATTVFFIMLPLSKETKIISAFFSSSNPPKNVICED
jgi:hypothetical protein